MSVQPGVITYPIPPYSNVPIQPQNYQPSQFVISAVTLGQITTVTTSTNHNYVIGQQVRLLIPPTFGCIQLNEQTGYVFSIPAANQVTVNINSTNFDPYVASSAKTVAQIVAMGDINGGQINANGTVNLNTPVPGAFINISP